MKINANTYFANIRRFGQKFRSQSTPSVTYSWMESLSVLMRPLKNTLLTTMSSASPVLKIIGKDWDSKMNKQLPKIRVPMMAAFSMIWKNYLDALQKDINTNVPPLEVSFNNMRPLLDTAQRATENKIRNTLGKLSQKASSVTFDAVQYLTDEMEPTFKEAQQICKFDQLVSSLELDTDNIP